MNEKILIYGEITREKVFAPVVKELAFTAQQLSEKFDECEKDILLITTSEINETIYNDIKAMGFDKAFFIKNKELEEYSNEYFSNYAIKAIKQINPTIVLIGATTQGRDLAPRISSALNTGLTADCTKLDINEDLKLSATRPTFGGNLMATILCKNLPQMATVRPHVIKITKDFKFKETEFIDFNYELDNICKNIELIEFIKNPQTTTSRLDNAEIVVAGGKGMKSKDGFKLIEKLANKLNGAVGASRAIVDLGWVNHELQVGQTGKTITPKLYIACGISGAIQHQVGINGAEHIIAINSDKNAPIFKNADFGIVGDALDIIPKLINLL